MPDSTGTVAVAGDDNHNNNDPNIAASDVAGSGTDNANADDQAGFKLTSVDEVKTFDEQELEEKEIENKENENKENENKEVETDMKPSVFDDALSQVPVPGEVTTDTTAAVPASASASVNAVSKCFCNRSLPKLCASLFLLQNKTCKSRKCERGHEHLLFLYTVYVMHCNMYAQ
ncbi:hypothetical protein RFI_07317 [Reticulomyxa filosa]|uniref:Uncharacterized protein n=1 Tax=Reticulomyxa filosa TaxID=46433 RepID=X6NWY4_RETFI|nr:hypothetical protein RFI_07317 [Reticulomyxa filosa]|eukprot:ETO29802.1 hypothetical protein RFI_07317 [Reticulomyxa filosa]